MRRIHLLLAFLLASLAGASTAASAQAPSSTAHAARAAKVQVRSSKLGKILVNASGFTLYRFTSDPRNKDTCLMVSECSQTWPVPVRPRERTRRNGLRGPDVLRRQLGRREPRGQASEVAQALGKRGRAILG
jgi:predicted lipoprotein with Yx(FWY)xxD motif